MLLISGGSPDKWDRFWWPLESLTTKVYIYIIFIVSTVNVQPLQIESHGLVGQIKQI